MTGEMEGLPAVDEDPVALVQVKTEQGALERVEAGRVLRSDTACVESSSNPWNGSVTALSIAAVPPAYPRTWTIGGFGVGVMRPPGRPKGSAASKARHRGYGRAVSQTSVRRHRPEGQQPWRTSIRVNRGDGSTLSSSHSNRRKDR